MERQRENQLQRQQRLGKVTAVRSGTTPWLFDDVREVMSSFSQRRSPQQTRRRDLRLLFGS